MATWKFSSPEHGSHPSSRTPQHHARKVMMELFGPCDIHRCNMCFMTRGLFFNMLRLPLDRVAEHLGKVKWIWSVAV